MPLFVVKQISKIDKMGYKGTTKKAYLQEFLLKVNF